MNSKHADLLTLDRAERLQLVEELWDSLVDDPAAIPIPDWQREELLRRRANWQQEPANVRSWGEVKRRARGQ